MVTISLKGNDIDTSMKKAIAALYEVEVDELDEEFMQSNVDKIKRLYCEEKPYYAYVVNAKTCDIPMPASLTKIQLTQ